MTGFAICFILAALFVIAARIKNTPDCRRVELGYNCKGDRCECKKVDYER